MIRTSTAFTPCTQNIPEQIKLIRNKMSDERFKSIQKIQKEKTDAHNVAVSNVKCFINKYYSQLIDRTVSFFNMKLAYGYYPPYVSPVLKFDGYLVYNSDIELNEKRIAETLITQTLYDVLDISREELNIKTTCACPEDDNSIPHVYVRIEFSFV